MDGRGILDREMLNSAKLVEKKNWEISFMDSADWPKTSHLG